MLFKAANTYSCAFPLSTCHASTCFLPGIIGFALHNGKAKVLMAFQLN
jgi:hypothetical protein